MDSSLNKISRIDKVEVILNSAFSAAMIEEFEWPAACFKIPCNCFCDCEELRKITGIEAVTDVGVYAFADCPSLTEFRWPEACEEVPNFCFEGCTSLANFSYSEKLKKIGEGAFAECDLQQLDLSGSCVSYIGDSAFEGIDKQNIKSSYFIPNKMFDDAFCQR